MQFIYYYYYNSYYSFELIHGKTKNKQNEVITICVVFLNIKLAFKFSKYRRHKYSHIIFEKIICIKDLLHTHP